MGNNKYRKINLTRNYLKIFFRKYSFYLVFKRKNAKIFDHFFDQKFFIKFMIFSNIFLVFHTFFDNFFIKYIIFLKNMIILKCNSTKIWERFFLNVIDLRKFIY